MILALSGWKGCGKDTLGKYFIRRGFQRRAFADTLKDETAKTYGVDRAFFDTHKEHPLLDKPARAEDAWSVTIMSMLYGHLRTEDGRRAEYMCIRDGVVYGVFGRLAPLTRIGITWGCELIPLYHTPRSLLVHEGSCKRAINPNHWVDAVLKTMNVAGYYVLTDLRYRSELARLRRVPNRLRTVRITRDEWTVETDSSERDLDHTRMDYEILNRGTIEELHDCGEEILHNEGLTV